MRCLVNYIKYIYTYKKRVPTTAPVFVLFCKLKKFALYKVIYTFNFETLKVEVQKMPEGVALFCEIKKKKKTLNGWNSEVK